jgi:hypothetical protein
MPCKAVPCARAGLRRRPGHGKEQRKQTLEQAHLRYITALTNRSTRSAGCIPERCNWGYSTNRFAMWSAGVRYVLRKNEAEAARDQHRLQDKLEKLEAKIVARNDELRLAQWKLDGRSVVSSPIVFIDDS